MKFYIIAGESSGDLHGSNLIREIKTIEPSAVFRCWGGDRMKQQGAELVKHYSELAFMGFTEVLLNLRTILKNIDFCKKDILNYKPDALILVDYPGFNLRIARFAKKSGIKVFYYISPQVWAWKSSRVQLIKKYVDRMLVILPFEKEFYKKFDYEVDFVGHPLLDALPIPPLPSPPNGENTPLSFGEGVGVRRIVALLPGSRKQEIERMLPVMANISSSFPDHQFVVAGISAHPMDFYSALIGKNDVRILMEQTYQLLDHASAALVTSGTATLETALFAVPEVVCYKGGMISYHIAKRLVKVNYISLVNLIMEEEAVKELVQSEFNETNLKSELEKILYNTEYRTQMIARMQQLKNKLGGPGASRKAAEKILTCMDAWMHG